MEMLQQCLVVHAGVSFRATPGEPDLTFALILLALSIYTHSENIKLWIVLLTQYQKANKPQHFFTFCFSPPESTVEKETHKSLGIGEYLSQPKGAAY